MLVYVCICVYVCEYMCIYVYVSMYMYKFGINKTLRFHNTTSIQTVSGFPSSVLKYYEQLQNISKYSFVKINVLTCIN